MDNTWITSCLSILKINNISDVNIIVTQIICFTIILKSNGIFTAKCLKETHLKRLGKYILKYLIKYSVTLIQTCTDCREQGKDAVTDGLTFTLYYTKVWSHFRLASNSHY